MPFHSQRAVVNREQALRSLFALRAMGRERASVTDVAQHPVNSRLLTANQAGTALQWLCEHGLVSRSLVGGRAHFALTAVALARLGSGKPLETSMFRDEPG